MVERLLSTTPVSIRPRLLLLAGQAFFFGITLAMFIVSASAIFLSEYGAGRLPYVYIAVAFLGALLSYGLAALQQRWTLAKLSINSTAGLALLSFLAWLALRVAHATWVSFFLLVIFSLYLQLGFVFIGGQAGRLFDVRQIKVHFSRVVFGFAVGFMIGGFLAPLIVSQRGLTEDLLLGAVASLLITLLLLLITSRRFATELTVQTTQTRKQPMQSLWKLLRKPFVLLIIVYQMLSAIGTQLIDFMLYERAAARYSNSADLAQFVGNFTALLNLVDIVFLALLAGFLVSRLGLNFGLMANPAGVGILLVGLLVVGFWAGPASILFFILVAAARIADISLTDGTTRTALNAAYQALPAHEQLAVQTAVEGIGVPLALGLTGVILLVFQAIPSLTILHLTLLAFGVTVVWTLLGFWVYRGYATSLLRGLQDRSLGESELSLNDSASVAAVERLIASDQLRNVQLGLDLLVQANHPVLTQQLSGLVTHSNGEIQREALKRIEQLQLKSITPQVERLLQTTDDGTLKPVVLRALAALSESEAIPTLTPYLDHADPALRSAAMVGLLRYGGIAGVLATGERLMVLPRQPDPAARCLAAEVIGEVGVQQFYQPLQALLEDHELSVRQAAIHAAAQVRNPQLLPLLLRNLSLRETRTATINALAAYGETILPFVEQALSAENSLEQGEQLALLQLCAQIKSEKTTALLLRYLDHRDRTLGYALLVALHSLGYRAKGEEIQRFEALLQQDSAHSVRILLMQRDLGQAAELTMLQRALEDELALLRQRIFRTLALLHDAQAILRAEQQLRLAPDPVKALAVEMLDVTLPSAQKSLLLPLVNPQLSNEQRLQQLAKVNSLSKWIDSPASSVEQGLAELIGDAEGHGAQAWLRACAIYGAGRLLCSSCRAAIVPLQNSPNALISETASWALARL